MRYRYLAPGLVGTVISFALASTLVAQTAVDSAAKVIRIKGPAKYTVGGVTKPLEVGTVLKAGAIIQAATEPGSYVDLVLGEAAETVPSAVTYRPYIPTSFSTSVAFRPIAEQNVIRIWENTVLGIDKLTTQATGADEVTETQLDLKTGRISGTVKKMSAGSRYEVKLPNGVAGIRGTSYDLAAEGVVKVLAGSVALVWGTSQTAQLVTEGNQYDARTGQMTPIPQMIIKMFDEIFAAMRVVLAAAPTTYASDKTVRNVSPVVGQ
jgi:hypothetical protein